MAAKNAKTVHTTGWQVRRQTQAGNEKSVPSPDWGLTVLSVKFPVGQSTRPGTKRFQREQITICIESSCLGSAELWASRFQHCSHLQLPRCYNLLVISLHHYRSRLILQ